MTLRPSIVISGVGLATSLGLSAAETWQNVLESRPSLGSMPALEAPAPPEKGGYQVCDLPPDFSPESPREVRYLRWTVKHALEDAGILPDLPYPPDRCGFILGTTLHGMRAGGQFLRSGDFSHLRSFLAGNVIDEVASMFPFTGDALTTCSACSSSLGSIALAITLLETGQLDLVVSGGYDTVSEYAYAGFNSLRLVTDGPLRPFSKNRQGMKLGEGYGIVILERAADATRRGKKAPVAILGYGESADAHHLTQPHPQGLGAAAAIRAALHRAGLDPENVDLVAAHATGTPDNDAGEHAALANVFGTGLSRVPVVAFKSHVGHTLGGAGAVELILSSMALRDQTVPACANIAPDELEFSDLSVAIGKPRKTPLRATLNTSLGFGGANTCAIMGLATDATAQIEMKDQREVLITGIGVVLPGAVGLEAFAKRLAEPPPDIVRDTGMIAESEYVHLLNARRIRRMSDYVKLTLAATTLALQDAGVADDVAFKEQCSALLGTAHGGSTFCIDYYRQIVAGGMIAANPMLFAEGVPNAAAAHLSLMLSLKGACQTVIGSRTSGLDALRLASLRIASGQWDRAIVGAAEEYHTIVNEAYRKCRLYSGGEPSGSAAGSNREPSGFATGSGAVTLVLESRASLESRHGCARGRVLASKSARCDGRNLSPAIEAVLATVGVNRIVSSANNTWIDAIEAKAIERSLPGASSRSLYGRFPELFSVTPLAGVAATVVAPDWAEPSGDRDSRSIGVIASGYASGASGVEIERLSR